MEGTPGQTPGPGMEQLRALYDQAPDGLLVVESESGSIILANASARSMLGLDAKRIPGEHVSALFPDDQKLSVKETLDRVKVQGSCIVQCFLSPEGQKSMDLTATLINWGDGQKVILAAFRDASEREALAEEKERLIQELKQAVARVKRLSCLLPICSNCKKIRDDSGYWHRVEVYLEEHADATLTHGICPDCIAELYPSLKKELDEDGWEDNQ